MEIKSITFNQPTVIIDNYEHYHKVHIIRKIIRVTGNNPIIIKVKENITDKESQELEIDLITKIGRLNLDKGPLTNLTDCNKKFVSRTGIAKFCCIECRNKDEKRRYKNK
jgi:hypothetical protein